MPRLIALEWDDAEARVAVAEVRRGSITLEHAFSVKLPGTYTPGSPGSSDLISASGAHDLGAIGRRIGEALTARGVRKSKTLIAVGRTNIELKNLSMPPAPPEELPELVRFQAEREFNTLGDDWPLDFIPQPGEPGEPQTVLAAAISPELVGEIENTCQAAGLVADRLILRPCAAASLLSRIHPAEQTKLRLLVDLLADEADLTVLAGDTVVFLRTARLPHDLLESDPLRALLPEIRRTIAAVQNRLQGKYISEVFLCGAGVDQEALVREIGRDLNLPAELFNPLACCTLAADLQRSLPAQPSQFAPLVGMLLDDAPGGAATIDFLNPRQKPKQVSQQRKLAVPLALAATVLLGGVGILWLQLHALDVQIDDLTQSSIRLDPQVKVETEKQMKPH
jgi:Tfp pilus assembly PilM family ATPase